MDGGDKYIGRILDNRYEILELIGAGGMALVYRARCHRLNRMVAIKILKEDLADDEEFRRRFHTESQAVAMLSHPNIVSVYDVSRTGNIEYIVMELIEGITLKQYINRKGLLNWKESLHFATQVTKALSHAHSRGIIHRDIKPHNIMILKDGSVKVADFGIARLLSMANTLTQEALGSVHYISPEQAKGGDVDARSDIYSVGVVMYEMLTSRLPFVGESAVSVAIQHISAIPLMPRDINPEIPVGLEDITMQAMQPDINLRFITADEMLKDLEDFRKNPSIVFDYGISAQKDRQPSEIDDYEEIKIAPKTPPKQEAGSAAAPAASPQEPIVSKAARRPQTSTKKRAAVKAEMTGNEYRAAKTNATATSTLIGIFSIIVFIILVLIFMWNFFLKEIFNTQEREQVTIDNFVNFMYEDLLKNEDFQALYNFIIEREEYSREFRQGAVISQRPIADRQQTAPLRGGKIDINLVISLGEEPPAIMPNIVGMYYSEAINRLNAMNMNLSIGEDIVGSDIERGYVIETRPAANMSLSRGDTVVIVYSSGPEPRFVTVPSHLTGSTTEDLVRAFRELDLIPDFTEVDDNSPAGTVLYIDRGDQEIQVPAHIVVHISRGPPDPPPTDDPPTDQPPTDDPPTDQPPTDDPPTDPPPTDPPPTDDPPTEIPHDENPTAEDPPTEHPAEAQTTEESGDGV